MRPPKPQIVALILLSTHINTQTHRHTDTQTHRHTDVHNDTQAHSFLYPNISTHRHSTEKQSEHRISF